MPMYSYRCSDPECDHLTARLRKYEDREAPDTCEICDSPATYRVEATIFNHAHPDGLKRSDPKWAQIRTVSKLQVERVRAPHGSTERKEIDKAIKEVKRRAKDK